jgi:hypothetical protein
MTARSVKDGRDREAGRRGLTGGEAWAAKAAGFRLSGLGGSGDPERKIVIGAPDFLTSSVYLK